MIQLALPEERKKEFLHVQDLEEFEEKYNIYKLN